MANKVRHPWALCMQVEGRLLAVFLSPGAALCCHRSFRQGRCPASVTCSHFPYIRFLLFLQGVLVCLAAVTKHHRPTTMAEATEMYFLTVPKAGS